MVLQTEKPPLTKDSSGGLRIGDSRVLLEMVVGAFEMGSTPETIVQQYPTATLADVYSVIGYYLRHKDEVEAYLAEREAQADTVHEKLAPMQKDLSDIRQRLQKHRKALSN